MVNFEFEALNKDIKKLKELFSNGLREVVRTFVQNMVQEIAYDAPLGDAKSNASLYHFRRTGKNYGNPRMKEKEGVSANNWRVAFGSGTSGYNTDSSDFGEVTDRVGANAYNKMSSYKLGQTVYIVNNVPHINQVITGEYKLPHGTIVNKEPFGPELLRIVESSYDTFNREVGKLELKLKG